MDAETLSLLARFDAVGEVIQTLLVSDAESDYRIELVRCHKGGRTGYKPRIYRQETVVISVISGERYDPKPREMLVWRDYEMGFKPTDDLNMALKMAAVVIKENCGR